MDNDDSLTNKVVVRALCKYAVRDNRFSRFYQLRQKHAPARAFRKQSDYLNNLIYNFMKTTKRSFEAKVIEVNNSSAGRYLRYVNMNSGEEGKIPEWCIVSFAILPKECLDEDGHIVEGSVLKLREMEDGKVYPGMCYQRRAVPLQKPGIKMKKMSKESLYEGATLYQSVPLGDLWKMFEQKLRNNELTADAILQAMEVKSKSSEKEQRAYLSLMMEVNAIDIAIQENQHQEFKESFLHSSNNHANTLRSGRSVQYREIFKEIAAFGNSQKGGEVFIGVDNNGTVCGIEDELLNEAPFDNRADFQADFLNQLSQAIDNYAFVSSVKIIWYKTAEDKLFCRICVPIWKGSILLLNGCELYVRGDASKKQLKNTDFINHVAAWLQNNVA